MSGNPAKDTRIALRVTPEQKLTIEAAARALGRTVTDFTVAVAVERAEDTLADRRVFHVPADRWEEFERALDAPVDRINPRLVETIATPTVFKQP